VKVGITCGDPAGIGPEVVRAALESARLPREFEYLVIGATDAFTPGKPERASAKHAIRALEEAIALAKDKEIQAVVTGPVSKKAMHSAGFEFPGQTEFFAERCGVSDFAMCLTGGKITVALVTAHVALSEVSRLLSRSEIVRVGRLLAAFLARRGVKRPRIAVAGLNPHAGESGDLGSEEIDVIAPAVESLCLSLADAAEVSGPHSPDTLFNRMTGGEFDGVLCMYHDQGLIPLKLHAFDEGVNVTLGLPFPRTSPDHGTAFEIAGKGIARPTSMISAIRLACELTHSDPSQDSSA
jgi:4-hydroxythreonine-4-phosphate dehydrogenase